MNLGKIIGGKRKRLNVGKNLKQETNHTGYYDKFVTHRCDIELVGWNDGVFDAVVINQDKSFLFYYLTEEKVQGAIGKKHICKISICEKERNIKEDYELNPHDFSDFIDKEVTINLYEKGFFDGIIGEDTELSDVTITEKREDSVIVEPGLKEIPLNQITKIEIINKLRTEEKL